ncbi:hypothetical protein V866_004780 [Kwoniella sp. B9012]
MKYSTLLLLIAIQARTVWSFTLPYDFLNRLNDQFTQLTPSVSLEGITKEIDSLTVVLQHLSKPNFYDLIQSFGYDFRSEEQGDGDHNDSDSRKSDQHEDEDGYRFSPNWEDLPEAIKQYIKDHPYQSVFHVVNGVVFLAPGLSWGPVLGLLGFTGIGPAAGSTAAFAQSWIHPVISKGIFATCQSAKMGGYGVGIMNTAIRTGMGMFSGACWVGGWFDGQAEAEAEREEDRKEDEIVILNERRVDL